jgi:hypothetical protein
VTRPRKFRHQHCNCSCHRGALFFNTRGTSFVKGPLANSQSMVLQSATAALDLGEERMLEYGIEISSRVPAENSVGVGAEPPTSMQEAGIVWRVHCMRRGPLVPKTLSS